MHLISTPRCACRPRDHPKARSSAIREARWRGVEVGGERVQRHLRRVDFPLPLVPTIAQVVPAGTWKEAPRRMGCASR